MEPKPGPAPSPAQSPPARAAGGGHGRHYAWAAVAAVAAVCLAAGFAIQQFTRAARDATDLPAKTVQAAVQSAAAGAERLVEAIRRETVTHTFREHLESLRPVREGRLLVAEARSNENFQASASSWWRGTSTAEIRVPATYHYYVTLAEPWEIEARISPEQVVTCTVRAPALRALENPAIDTARIERLTDNGWLRWDARDVADGLMREITPRLNERAAAKAPQYFPQAREAVEQFVRQWVLREYQVGDDARVYVRVVFANEPAAPAPGKN